MRAEEASQGPSRQKDRGRGRLSDAPDQFKVKATPSACGAAAQELGGGAEPRAYGLADGLGLGEGLVQRAVGGACARRARSNGPRRPLVVVVVVVVRTLTPNYLRQASPDRGKYIISPSDRQSARSRTYTCIGSQNRKML